MLWRTVHQWLLPGFVTYTWWPTSECFVKSRTRHWHLFVGSKLWCTQSGYACSQPLNCRNWSQVIQMHWTWRISGEKARERCKKNSILMSASKILWVNGRQSLCNIEQYLWVWTLHRDWDTKSLWFPLFFTMGNNLPSFDEHGSSLSSV